MKRVISNIVLLLVFCGCATIKPTKEISTEVVHVSEPAVNFSEQSTWLLGYINRRQFTIAPHSTWFLKEYDDYQPTTDAINRLFDINKDGLTIKIVIGTWCPDSRREVPHFIRILDIWQFPAENVTFIGVDNARLSPVGEYDKLDIQRVPTFIIYENNIEAGRIIENPTTSLEQDMVNILKRK